MAIEKVIDLQVKSNAEQAVGSLRAQLRAAQLDVATLSEKFGATSKEAVEAAKRAGELKDKIGDAKALTDAFNPDAKFKALTSSLAGVAGGFAAVQGGMALIGVESESVEKTLLKVQSAMALSTGLQAIGESVDSFKQLGAVVQSSTAFKKLDTLATVAATVVQRLFSSAVTATAVSFNILKTAIVSTGIGALVVGLGFLVAKMNESSDATEEMTEKQKELNKELEYGKELADSTAKSIDYNTQIELANAKKRGASDEELTRIKVDGVNQRLKANSEEINKIKSTQENEVNLTKEQNKRIQDLRNENLDLERKARIDIANFQADLAVKQREKEKELQEAATEKEKERKRKELEAIKKHHDDLLKEAEEFFRNAAETEKRIKEEGAQLILDQRTVLEEGVKEIYKGSEDEQTQTAFDNTQARIKLIGAETQARVQALDAVSNTLEMASELAGKQTGVGKTLAVVAATISMFTSAQKAYESTIGIPFVGPTLAPINAGLAIAVGLKNIANINKVKVPGGGGGSAPSVGGNAFASGSSTPNFNVVGNSGVNQLAGVLSNREQTPIKTYVVAQDVTSGQSLDRNAISGASFG